MVVDGEHEAIISAEEWKAAQDKRKTTGVKRVKTHSLEHEHILTGILKCPGCGANMYGNVNVRDIQKVALIEIISIMPVSILLGPRDISAITISNGTGYCK